ncbi:NAD(P)-dependent oxidoreductase [Sphingomonas sp. Y38-1Y]|uniref:NAD(P)-dependent oxidoreductase n=1 Tax=Sphingomonas sp. Y38-1Y TaxID=3078265 RepID=UPI0028E78BB6|nr:NAD(P)-dependent oxidoreductase [Sphingomonas sp. Y38-1Y]
MTVNKVAVLGLGLMGAGMARKLVEAGLEVAVWNRNPAKSEPLGQAGARVAATPADAARGADLVVAMLANDDASREVWLGPDGALGAMEPGSIAVEASTLTHDWIVELASEATARDVSLLDAPVTGSRQQAEEGALRFLVGGDADVVGRARPVLTAMGSGGIEHLGPTGSGALVKLANNYLCGVQVASLAEAIVMLERNGLDIERAVEVLLSGAPASPMVKLLSRRMLDRAYAPNFFVPLMAKDLGYAERMLGDAAIESELAAAARRRFEASADAGHAEADIAAVIKPLRDQAT